MPIPGKVLDNKLTVACKDQSIKILEIQKKARTDKKQNSFCLAIKSKQNEKIF